MELPEARGRPRELVSFQPDGVVVEAEALRIAEAVRAARRRHGLDVVVMEETQGWAGYLQRQIDIPVVITLHCPWFMQRGFERRKHGRGRRGARAQGSRCAADRRRHHRAVLRRSGEATRTEARLPADVPQAVVSNPMPAPGHRGDGTAGLSGCASGLLLVGRFDRFKKGEIPCSPPSRSWRGSTPTAR